MMVTETSKALHSTGLVEASVQACGAVAMRVALNNHATARLWCVDRSVRICASFLPEQLELSLQGPRRCQSDADLFKRGMGWA